MITGLERLVPMSLLGNPGRIEWSDPIRLRSYLLCPTGPGLYAIGEPRNPSAPIAPATEYDPYMGRWPENFRGLYIGISLSKGEGIRRRLRAHARGRGCKGLRSYLSAGVDLHFLYIAGLAATNYEALYVHMSQDEIFPLNRRSELKRQAQRFWREMEAADLAAGRKTADFFSIPGYFEDG
jgi:hypothetical protein